MNERCATPILSVKNVSTGYGDLRVVWDVSFDVRPGQLSVVLGRNGAGKTTTLRAIAGLNPVNSGTITFDGDDLSRLGPSKRVERGIAFVQEGKRIFHTQTVEQNLLLGGISRKTRKSGLRSDVDHIYDLFPVLADKRGLAAGSMSGGQQQMLSIGSALMSRPRVLLLDEPSGGLAPVIVKDVMAKVSELTDDGIAVVLVEQAVEASMAVADHVTVLNMGKVALSAPASDIENTDALLEAYFGTGSST